jgi:hypothetical protein
MDFKNRRHRNKGIRSKIVANTNVIVLLRIKKGAAINDGRVVVDDMTDRRRIVLIRVHHPPPLFPAGAITVVNAITIVDMSIFQTTSVVALIDGNSSQGRSRTIAIMGIDRQVDDTRKRTLRLRGRSIAIDIELGQDQGLVDHPQRILSTYSCLLYLRSLI